MADIKKTKKRCRHDPRKRLARVMTGATITFDGNSDDKIIYRQASGLPMTRYMIDVATGWAWRWDVTLGIRACLGSTVRCVEDGFSAEQKLRLDDLTEMIDERHQIMLMELPAAWKGEAKTWTIKIIG